MLIGIIASVVAYRAGSRYGDPKVVLYDGTDMADPGAEAFRYKLSDGILDALDHDRGPREILRLVGLGTATTFSVGLSDANAQQFFVHALGGGGARIIVRSTDEKRQLSGGLTRPIGRGVVSTMSLF
ncbi:hypothetical protein [Silvibacterium acidisoli]|uniref:hypothetical protein n=1 Tax=Acidobacteriaceae bacterium ZG23-2 TaxID=2883246 RepID=UPI00406BEFE6